MIVTHAGNAGARIAMRQVYARSAGIAIKKAIRTAAIFVMTAGNVKMRIVMIRRFAAVARNVKNPYLGRLRRKDVTKNATDVTIA